MDPRAIYCTPFLVAATLIFVVGIFAYRRRQVRGAWYLTLVCLAASVWAATEGLLYLGLDTESNILITKFQYLGITLLPPLALLCGISLFGLDYLINRSGLLLLLLGAVTITVLVWTNPIHKMVFTDYYTIDSGPFPMLGLRHGLLWWIMLFYHYSLIAVLGVVALFEVFSSTGFHRSQAIVILVAVTVVWALNAVYVSGNSPVPNMDIGPLAFARAAATMAWGFFRYNLLDLVPIARSEIFRGLKDAILVIDAKSRIIDINPAAEALFGSPLAAAVGQEAHSFFAGHPQLHSQLADLKPGEIQMTAEGQERVYDFRGSALVDKGGALLGSVVVLRNITEHKQAEEERKALEFQLTQSQKMESIGVLAGGVAHDLNNLLSGVTSYPEFLLLDLPEDSPLRKPLLTIQRSGEKAVAVVQDLLTLARRGITSVETVNLNRIVSEQLESPEYERLKSFHPNVDLEINLGEGVSNINGSAAHLSKAIMNLVTNAAEAMPEGGRICISTENLYIDRPISGYDRVEKGEYVSVSVVDTGTGISEEDLGRIFEPFYTKKGMGRSGSGLGMSVVWGTVKDHKGYIDVESTKGKGTVFTLYFPMTSEELESDEAGISLEGYVGKGESLLVVDDVEEQREIASMMLEKLGYSVTCVSGGEEAVEYLRDHSADLVVLDMIMDPGIDGLETYRRILQLHPTQKAIIASGFSETDRVREARRLGAGQYIKKPYVLERIGLAVKEELEK